MDEIEKKQLSEDNSNDSIKKALEPIRQLVLSETMNPYHKLIQNIGIAATDHQEVFCLTKVIGNIAETSNFLKLIQPMVDPEALSISKSIASIASTIMGSTPAFMSNLKAIQTNLGRIINTRIDWNAIVIPGLSEEKKKERIEAFRQWGAYGWTVIPHANFKYFNTAPTSSKEANEKALSCFRTKKQMEEFWKAFDSVEKIKRSDFEEAIKDFDNRCYKSCAMMLYSLIDGRLIRLQGGPKTEKENLESAKKTKRKPARYSGAAAVNRINNKYNEVHEDNIKVWFFSNLTIENLFCALAVLYANGNDFKEQPAVMNRNFVDHGMLHRKVRRMDCIQLFLAYYNFLTFENRLTAEDRKELKGIV